MKVQLTTQAASDVREADAHYGALDPGLHDAFQTALDQVIERILMFPRGAPPVEGHHGIRRARMRRFPYGVFYRIDDAVIVLRVLHAKREGFTG